MLRVSCGLLLAATFATAADCGALAKLTLPSTRITAAVPITTGVYKTFRNLPPFCRIAGVIRPSADSEIKFEAWLPLSNWNRKFYGTGNGGYAGTLPLAGLADAIRAGYASAATDTGHTGDSRDAQWALGHPEKIIDFGHRAIHETAEKGKAIAAAFYGSAPRKSYFASCSNGGRQALMEAQRYPADYDGILAGAPANNWTVHNSNRAFKSQATTADPASYIPPSKLPAIEAAIAAACDLNDRVKDGVIENPAACHPDLDVLLCKGAESDACLTKPQLHALKILYAPLRNAKGEILYPGFSPGGEAGAGGWSSWITGPKPETSALHAYANAFFRYLVYDDPNWNYRSFNLERDLPVANQKMAAFLNATNPDLSPFAARGGKLILYHGWGDPGIPPQNTIDYYQSVRKTLGSKKTASFVRLYMVPGMQHCSGGQGTNQFGQIPDAKATPATSITAALEHWVEKGAAPAAIIAHNATRTRPLCPYPKIAVYKGSGSTDEAANFRCAAPKP